MKRILILHTGGTISMSQDADGAVRPDKKNPLLAAGQELRLPADIELIVEDFSNLPSPHITVETMFEIKERIKQAKKENIDSVVVIVVSNGTVSCSCGSSTITRLKFNFFIS